MPDLSRAPLCESLSSRYEKERISQAANIAQALDAQYKVATQTQFDWHLDTEVSTHMTSSVVALDTFGSYNSNGRVIVGNGDALSISHLGSHFVNNKLPLLDVLVVPHITNNFLSVSKLTTHLPVDVLFSNKSFVI